MKTIAKVLIGFFIGVIITLSLFYHKDFTSTSHLEWQDLWADEGKSCLMWWEAKGKTRSTGHEIICI